MHDPLGDTMKLLEAETTLEQFSYDKPMYVRVDGRSFSMFTQQYCRALGVKGFSDAISTAMAYATEHVMLTMQADVGYCQSDEASFGWFPKLNPKSQHIFNGKVMKLCSVVPSTFTMAFYQRLEMLHPGSAQKLWSLITFDARVVDCKDFTNLQRMFYWRYLDARRNCISMFARQHWSHKALQGMKTVQILEHIEMDEHVRTEWKRLSSWYKEGVFTLAPLDNDYYEIASRERFIGRFNHHKELLSRVLPVPTNQSS